MIQALRVLIVEDEAIIAYLLEHQLRSIGCEVLGRISKGEEVLEAFLRHQPELVLMDIRLAGAMSGIEAAKAILQQAAVKIAFMTAFGDAHIRQEISAIQHLAYLEKPVPFDKLREIVQLAKGS